MNHDNNALDFPHRYFIIQWPSWAAFFRGNLAWFNRTPRGKRVGDSVPEKREPTADFDYTVLPDRDVCLCNQNFQLFVYIFVLNLAFSNNLLAVNFPKLTGYTEKNDFVILALVFRMERSIQNKKAEILQTVKILLQVAL